MLLIGKKPWGYHAYLPCLRCPSPLFTVPISIVYDAHLPCLRCLFPLFTMPISLVYDAHLHCLRFYFACLMTDSRIFEPTFLYRVYVWDAWLTGDRAVYSAECLRVMWLGGLIVV